MEELLLGTQNLTPGLCMTSVCIFVFVEYIN